VERPHWGDYKHGEGTTITWNQNWLLDASQIHKVRDARDDPEMMACYDSKKRATGLSPTEPNTPGNWGDWIVGGEVLHSPEVKRGCGTKCSFSFEKLRDVENRLQEAVQHDPWRSGYTRQYREWRQLDYENIVIQSSRMSKWIDEFPLRQATSLKAFPPPVQVDSMDYFHQGEEDFYREEAYHNRLDSTGWDWEPPTWEANAYSKNREEDLRIAVEYATEYIAAMSDEEGAWQHNRTPLPCSTMKLMRDPGYTGKIADWPMNEMIDGFETRKIGRLTTLFR